MWDSCMSAWLLACNATMRFESKCTHIQSYSVYPTSPLTALHVSCPAEDQFDFHSYCVRKLTLRAYIGLLRMEDRLHNHPFYIRVSALKPQYAF